MVVEAMMRYSILFAVGELGSASMSLSGGFSDLYTFRSERVRGLMQSERDECDEEK
jgi:hypothetical protein